MQSRARYVRLIWVGLLVGSLLLAPIAVRAETPATTQTTTPTVAPPSANAVTGFFKQLFSLWDVTDTQNWVAYSAIGTFLYYKFFYKSALATASAAREAMRKRLVELDLQKTEREKLLAEADELLEELSRRIGRTGKATEELEAHILNIRKGKRGRYVKQSFNGLADFHKLESWLASPEAKAFLDSKQGQNWKTTYDGLKDILTTQIDEPLSKLISKANVLYPNETFQNIESVPPSEGGRPGDFTIRNDFTHRNTPIGLAEINARTQNMRARCLEPIRAAAGEATQLTKNSNFWRYWTRPKNIKWPLFHAVVSLGGLGGTYWLHRAVDYDRRQAEAASKAKQKSDAASDLAGTLATTEGRKLMTPYYDIVRDVMRSHRDQLLPMAMTMLELDPQKPESKEKAMAFLDETFNSEAFGVALEQATIAAAKKKQGDRGTREALLQMIDNAKKQKGVREGLFRPFTKEVVRGLVNNLWSHLTVNDPSEDFEKGVMGSILKRTEYELSKDPAIQPPPQQLVPPAPGVTPPNDKVPGAQGATSQILTNPDANALASTTVSSQTPLSATKVPPAAAGPVQK